MIYRNTSLAFLVAGLLLMASCAGSKNSTGEKVKKGAEPAAASGEQKEEDKLTQQAIFIDATKAKMLEDYQTAAEQFKQVLKADPRNDAAQYELAMIYFNAGQNQLAKQYIGQAVLNDSLNYVDGYVDSVKNAGSNLPQKTLVADAQASYRPNKWYLVLMADASTSLADYDGASKIYQRLLSAYPTEIDYYFDWAYALIRQNKFADAMKIYDKMESLVGLDENIVLQKQRLYLQMGQLDKAIAEAQRLIKSDPENPRFYQVLADMYQANDKNDEAEKVFKDLLKVSPGNPYALLNLAEINRLKGNRDEYMSYLKQAFANKDLGVDSKIRVLYPYLSVLAADTAKKKEAYQLTKIMVETHPDDAKSHAIYGDLFYQDNKMDSALSQYQQSLKIDSSTFEVWQQIFFIQADQKKYQDLVASTEKAIELFPNQALVYFFNGVAYSQLKLYKNAINSLNTAKTLALDNKNLKAQIYSSLGDAYNSLGSFNESDSAFEQALLLDGNNSYVLNNYSYYLSLRDANLQKAKEMSAHSNELEPKNGSFQDTYAWILFRLGEYKDALTWIEKAMDSGEAENPTILEHYGDILAKLGQIDKAVENWKKALQLGSDSKTLNKKIADKKYEE